MELTSERLGRLGTAGIVAFGLLAVVTLLRREYMIAGTSLLFLSFSIYLRETYG